MSTGVKAAPQCLEAYLNLKQQGAKKGIKYIIFKLNKGLTEIIVEKESGNTDYEEFLQSLPEDEPRYAVYDVEYETDDGGRRNKLVLVSWNPDNSKTRHKMVHAGSKEDFKKSLTGISVEVQATEPGEINYETVVDKLKRSSN